MKEFIFENVSINIEAEDAPQAYAKLCKMLSKAENLNTETYREMQDNEQWSEYRETSDLWPCDGCGKPQMDCKCEPPE